MGILDSMFDTEKIVVKKLTEAGKKFATELKVPANEVRILIAFKENGSPYGLLFHKGNKVRDVALKEIL